MMRKLFLLFVTYIILSVTAYAGNMQQISGAFAFPNKTKKNVVITRISVNPNQVAKNLTDNQQIMQKITVVACANGTCYFPKIRAGLGFYETQFKLTPESMTARQFDLLVVACSYLGCDKKALEVKITQ